MSTTIESVTAASAGTWRLDPVHSSAGFEVSYLGGTFRGQFRDVDAKLTAANGTIDLTGRTLVQSVDVKDENLAAHLQGPDFFDAERYPELTFTATGIEPAGPAVDAEGEITIKGITRPVRVTGTITGPITDGYGNERLGVKLSATVDRQAFGVSWNTPLPSGEQALSDEVAIDADLFFVKEA
jgi:polyisoprenoid-binding protein YceI